MNCRTRWLTVGSRAFVVLGLVALVLGGCKRGSRVYGSGTARTETRDVATFDQVRFEGGGTLEARVGPAGPVKVTADDNILPVLETKVADGVLLITPKVAIEPDVPIVVEVSMESLTCVTCRGAGDIRLHGIANDALTIEIEGAGHVFAVGKTAHLDVSISGAGYLDLTKLQAETAKVTLSGTGSADVNATDTLTATINGTGRITYVGDPKVEKTINGLGVIAKRE